jgi:hypothetical protein
MLRTGIYNLVKNYIPRLWQIEMRRLLVRMKLARYADTWPIDPDVGKAPEGWTGWPEGKEFALVLTHDVEKVSGLDRCYQLAMIEERMGLRSCFNFVPGDYAVPRALREYLTERGFEIGIHGLYHQQNPFRSRSLFQKHAKDINRY